MGVVPRFGIGAEVSFTREWTCGFCDHKHTHTIRGVIAGIASIQKSYSGAFDKWKYTVHYDDEIGDRDRIDLLEEELTAVGDVGK